MDVLKYIVFLNKLLRDVGELDASVFRTGEIGFEIEMFYVKSGKSIPTTRDDAVGNHFLRYRGSHFWSQRCQGR